MAIWVRIRQSASLKAARPKVTAEPHRSAEDPPKAPSLGHRLALLIALLSSALPWIEVRLFHRNKDHEHYGKAYWDQSGLQAITGDYSSRMTVSNMVRPGVEVKSRVLIGRGGPGDRIKGAPEFLLYPLFLTAAIACGCVVPRTNRRIGTTTAIAFAALLVLLLQLANRFPVDDSINEVSRIQTGSYRFEPFSAFFWIAVIAIVYASLSGVVALMFAERARRRALPRVVKCGRGHEIMIARNECGTKVDCPTCGCPVKLPACNGIRGPADS